MRRYHLDAVLAQLLIEWIAVVGAIADQILRLGLDHVEVEAQLYQPTFVVIGGMRADRKRQSMTIHDCHDFHAFPALRRSDRRPATLRHHESRIDEAHYGGSTLMNAKISANPPPLEDGIVPVAGLVAYPMILVAHPSFPAQTVPELIDYAKSNPGKVTMASFGIGTASHLAGELLKQ